MGLKVLHLIDSGGLYGAEKMLLNLVQEQLNRGHEPMILSAGEPHIEEKPIESEAKRLGLPVMAWRMTPGLNLKEAWRIIKWAQAKNYQFLHSHGFKFNVLIGLFPRFLRKIPSITTLHGYVHARRFSKMWVYECIDRVAIYRMDGVVLVAEAMKGEIPERSRASLNIRVIPNGLNIADLKKRSTVALEDQIQQFINSHELVILGIGRLSREKGFDHLLRAFHKVKSEFPGAGLILVGEGKQRDALEGLTAELDLSEAVLMPGYCSNVPALLKQARLLVMPSLTEGLPITLLEAMAIETPVLVSAVGEMPKALGYGKGGHITQSIEPAELADAMIALLHNSCLKKKTEWAAQAVVRDYSAEAMTNNYLSLYNTVAGQKT
ncbi:glycosyltransferase [Marinobacter sp. TBZ242]|uniref:Glycosyltransferase n=1 Tax=Marinobacter azerbaijanicus TaxID=3050455 RepID=A0ABT7I6I4_9GAMM|nr:glycosyltransferase [Marinobacter sp. TBZ242]MDL0429721.1 glycosyltransferase [Marinobacter sp. TBZ242]